jgi:peptidyl-prolyl cis-trans isomerase SurA
MGAVVCASLVGACQSNTAGTPKAPSADVWAVVDGRDIRREEVERAYRGVVQQTPTPPSEEEVLTMKLGIVDELITQSVLQARGRTLNIEVTDAEVETAFGERKKSVTDEAFQQQLTQRGLTADDMKAGVRRELFVKKVLDKEVSSKIAITDQDITDFYNNNRAQFNVAEPQFRIAQIVITPVPEQQLRNRMNDDAKSPAEAARKAQMLGERLRAGADFSQVAMDYSEDPQSAPQGGDLGFVPMSALNQVPPALRDAVLKSQPGNINTVSSGGAHTIVMLLGREAAGQRDLSAPNVRDGIRDILRDRKEQLLRAAYISSARNDAKVVNHLAQLVVSAQGKLPTLGPVAPGK